MGQCELHNIGFSHNVGQVYSQLLEFVHAGKAIGVYSVLRLLFAFILSWRMSPRDLIDIAHFDGQI